MKIGVNGRFLLKPYTGIGQYTINIFGELAKLFPDTIFSIVIPEAPEHKHPLEDLKNIKIIILPENKIGSAGMKKTYWEQVQLPMYFRKKKVDLIHFPYPSNPWMKISIPTIVTVHDTIPWVLAKYRKSFLTRLYQDRCKNAVKKADCVITVSESSKKEIAETCRIDLDNIRTVYNAVNKAFKLEESVENKSLVLKKYGIDAKKPFLLYMGGYDERKNVETLIETFLEEIAPKFEIDFVLAGGKCLNDKLYESFDYLTKLQNNTSLRLHKGKIVATGFIDEADLPALYQSAFAFLNLSRKEGFNLPLLEASVSKIPVITSDIPVHHEVADQSAIFCPPHDKTCLTVHLKKLLEDNAYYQKQKQKAESAVYDFSWKISAEKTMQIYNSVL